MPTSSSFFNLLEDLKVRYPRLPRKELMTLGSYIWKQLTWEEKYPYMLKAWRSKRRSGLRSSSHHAQNPHHMTIEIKLDFVNRLRKYAVEKLSDGVKGNLVQFLKIMSIKVWNQLLFVAIDPRANVAKRNLDSPCGVLQHFYKQMRQQRRISKEYKRRLKRGSSSLSFISS
ncbi:hypothetical protein GE061_008905 [Apolygus lucorum]|uniref:Uncharacterized protein n=1 Tax=Apolygus lucorum TaxID=248454 RepID=A0A8S9Y0S3_APOLU|nr:hypothetical protein GE061_008900 [Apolygus lucorum]KAF6214166.1 hypothetical protein GE061_008905 [Apolygus lucorum]